MTHNSVVWFEIYVQDMDRAKTFYESVFQVKLEKLAAPVVEMWNFPVQAKQTGTSGSLVHIKGVPSGGNSTIVYFACTDCAVEEARAVKFGGKIQKGKMPIGENGFVSLVQDTEGNVIGLHSMQ